jgi:DNA polymerase/3'-5' exonuclease PolX
MRSEALKKKYTINEYGIYHLKKQGRKMEKGEIVPTQEEKDIFDVIGKEYVEPQHRK